MPPEPLPWDRKDFYKERKHERSEPTAIGSGQRWREPPPHHGPRDFVRWGSGEFRRPPGHGKQGAWHLYPEEHGQGFTPPRPVDKYVEDESYRPSVSRGDGKYCRNSRETRGGLLGQKDWKGNHLEPGATSYTVPSRQLDMNVQRAGDDTVTYTSHPHSDFVNTWDQPHFKDQHDKMGSLNGLSTGQRSHKENSLGSMDWRPFKWARSGNLSARGSGFSHSRSSRSTGLDIIEAKADMQPRKTTPVRTSSGDDAQCTSVAPCDEAPSRKKQRLGWGEGLAKYEKKKVEGPEESVCKNAEVSHSFGSNMVMRSPIGPGLSDCASPATPSSVACSSSPGMEDRLFIKASVGNDNLSSSPGSVIQQLLEEHPINLENLDLDSIAKLSSSIVELLQSEDMGFMDSNVARCTMISKLMIWKVDILKALEITESEIDQLENELKSLNYESKNHCPYAAVASSLSIGDKAKPVEQRGLIPRPSPLEISSEHGFVDTVIGGGGVVEDVSVVIKNEDIDSPGTATSEVVEPLIVKDATSPSYMVKVGECSGLRDASKVEDMDHHTGDDAAFDDAKMPVDSKTSCSNYGNEVDILSDIMSSNRDSASRSAEIFNKLFPKEYHTVDIREASKSACLQNDSLIKQKFMKRKECLRTKERIVSLKFRAFLRLWKEDLHFLSISKYRAKSHKKIELSSRPSYIGFQKHRSSVRSRIASSGNSLIPSTQAISYAGKLLMETQFKHYRDTLKMPALILDEKDKVVSRFISSNGLVDDPCAVEKERAMTNPWTPAEKEIFMDKLAIFGKDFKKIASCLDHKTIADCIEFYYKNHKSDCFAKTKKKLECRKQVKSLPTNTYLLTSGKKWNRNMNAASLDMLGAASALAAQADGNSERQKPYPERFLLGQSVPKTVCSKERSSRSGVHGIDKEAAAADVLAGICGSLSSEAMSSCITSSAGPGDNYQGSKNQKVVSVTAQPSTEVLQNVEDETCSDESCGEMDSADWTDEEKSIFVQAVSSHGKDFVMISRCVGTRSREQCKVFFSKARKCLGLDLIHPVPGTDGTRLSDDANGSGSVAEDACVLEAAEICSKSESRVGVDLSLSVLSANHCESDPGHNDLQTGRSVTLEKNNSGNADFDDLKSKAQLFPDELQADDELKKVLDCELGYTETDVSKSATSKAHQTADLPANFEVAKVEMTEQVSSVVEPPPLVTEEAPSELGVVKAEVMVAGPVEGHGVELEREKSSSFTDGENAEQNGSSRSGQAACTLRKSKSLGDTSHMHVDQKSSQFYDISNTPVVSGQQVTNLLTVNDMDCNSAALKYERNPDQNLSSPVGLEMRINQCVGNSATTNNRQLCKDEDPLVDRHVKSSSLPPGPPCLPTLKEMIVDINCKRASAFPALQKVDKNISFGSLTEESFLKKCNGLNGHGTAAEMQFLSQKLEQSDQPRVHAESLSDTEKPSRNGDVKLFGQILSHPTSPKARAGKHEVDKGTNGFKLSSKPPVLKFPRTVDNSTSIFNQNSYSGVGTLPVRSYGFWDGNRLQTGMPSLPDSAILLAKYPDAFMNVPAPVSNLEPQALQAVMKTEQNMNGLPVFPTREMRSNGIADYQLYSAKMPPYMVDMRQDIYSEVQRRNGIEAVAGLQQQTRAMAGMNVVGRGGICVGGGCTGVSDPVAAIKMHYAKTDQLVGQVGSVIREDETWRNPGDVGR